MDPGRIEELRNPALFPEQPEMVEILQTHLSVVCLAGDFAYKFKKAIRLPFADFSTLENRKFYCEEELRLNRRLCPDVYLEVVPLRRDSEGALSLGTGSGEVVDYALRMSRLPAERMLDVLLEGNAVSARDVEGIAARMTGFHAKAPCGEEVLRWGDPEKLRAFALANFDETLLNAGPERVFPGPLHAALADRTRRDFDCHLPLLRERAASGYVVDGHGDLHARNICLCDPVAIYDCIEFNPAFRCGDTATEHAFLLMDLRFRGHQELAVAYAEAVISGNGDEGMREIVPMLMRYRAMVRAKVAAMAAGESELSGTEREDAKETAQAYLRLAAVSAIEEDGPWWLIFCGLPASGKSSIALSLAKASGGAWSIFSSDRIRKELAGIAVTEKLPEECYDPAFSRRTYEEVRARATSATAASRVVILDANFRSRAERCLALTAAREAGARLAILHIETNEAIVIERLAVRADDPECQSDANRDVYEKLKSVFEAPLVTEAERIIPVSGNISPDGAVDGILAELLVCDQAD